MERVLVIGGFGFYGDRVAKTLATTNLHVSRGTRAARGRTDAVEVDLGTPESFSVFADYDAIVNCSDSVNATPDDAIVHVLNTGGVWLEMGADAATTDRLLVLDTGPELRGTLLIGVGVFPGWSTALARAVAEDGDTCERIDLGIRFSPLSGAGRGNCALMAESLFVPATRVEAGQLQASRTAMGPTVALPFAGVSRPSVNFALPDTALIARATSAQTIVCHLSVVPSWLRFNFGILAWAAWLLRPVRKAMVWALTWQLSVLRAWLLRDVESRLEIVVIADRGTPRERMRELAFDDGQQATADGVRAAVEAWFKEAEHRPGVFAAAEYFTWTQLTGEKTVQSPSSRSAS